MKYWLSAIKTKLICFVLGVFIGQMSFINDAKAQNFAFQYDRKKDVISFDLIRNLIIIPVYINNKGPFNFILDTGVGPMVITDPKLKDSLNLTDPRLVKITGFGEGEEVFAYVAKTSVINIGEAVVQNLSTFVLKEDIFSLSAYVGKDIAGLIGYDFFNNFIVKINYPGHKITFSTHGKNDRLKGEKIPIELINQKPYLLANLQTEAFGKIDVKLIIDCGANHALSLERYNEKVFPPSTANIEGNLGVGLIGKISGHIGRTPSLKIGSFTFSNVLTNFPTYNEVTAKINFKERNGNLGADILRRFHVTFDYQNNAMYLKKNELYKASFEHDMSGMELYLANAPFRYCLVGRIEPGSPAETADFHINDQIISINFKSIEDYSFDEVAELFKSGNGRTLIIEIIRNKTVMIKIIQLKKRV